MTVVTFGTSMVFRALAGAQLTRIEEFAANEDDSYCLGPERAGCAEQAEHIRRQSNYAIVSNSTLVAAGAGAVAKLGYVIYVLAKKPKKEPAVAAGISLERAGGFISVSGRF